MKLKYIIPIAMILLTINIFANTTENKEVTLDKELKQWAENNNIALTNFSYQSTEYETGDSYIEVYYNDLIIGRGTTTNPDGFRKNATENYISWAKSQVAPPTESINITNGDIIIK